MKGCPIVFKFLEGGGLEGSGCGKAQLCPRETQSLPAMLCICLVFLLLVWQYFLFLKITEFEKGLQRCLKGFLRNLYEANLCLLSTLTLPCQVVLGESPKLSEPQLPHLKMGAS